MESITENKALMYSLCAVAGITYFAAAQISPDFTEFLELVEFPADVRYIFVSIIIVII
jgi:hypothetical protein